MSEFLSIQMDPMGTRGLPEEDAPSVDKPVIRKKLKFSKTLKSGSKTLPATVGTMFDHDYLSLIAVNMYPKFPLDTKVQWASVMQDGERILVVKVKGYEYTSHGSKIFVEKS